MAEIRVESTNLLQGIKIEGRTESTTSASSPAYTEIDISVWYWYSDISYTLIYLNLSARGQEEPGGLLWLMGEILFRFAFKVDI